MIGIVAHLLGYSFGRRASLCLLFYLLCFLYLLSILYDGFAGRGLDTLPLSMNIVDLRQTTVRQIEPLLEEEARHWRDELHWDYRGALELIKRFLDAHALAGCVAFETASPPGIRSTFSKIRKV